MKIHVKILVTPQQVLNNMTIILTLSKPITIKQLLLDLPISAKEKEEIFMITSEGEIELRPGLAVLLNGRNVALLNGLETVVSDDARVAIIHALGGG